MSQPTLNSSFSGINFVGINKGRLSYPSLRASGDNNINFRIEEERLSTPNMHSAGLPERGSRSSQAEASHVLRDDPSKRRERLSQPTLVTGDYYPGRGQQRLSQPCLSTGRELPVILHSPVKNKRFCSPAAKVTQRDRLSQLDFGAARYRNLKDVPDSVAKFNRDRFSIPELQTSNDLSLMAGTPKQRYSLDSSLNEPGRSKLLPIASSPIGDEQETGSMNRNASDGLESVLVTSTTPLLTKAFAPPALKTPQRERMSVPEIRTSSLRRLLDSPVKQRHSLTGNLRQCLLPYNRKHQDSGNRRSKPKMSDKEEKSLKNNLNNSLCGVENKEPTRHIQRHYSYTYDTKDGSSLLSSAPKKKYLESNFDKNEQVITTVIETEMPKLNNYKHINYTNETPKWIKRYLDLGNKSPKIGKGNPAGKKHEWVASTRGSLDSIDSEKTQSEKSHSANSNDNNCALKSTSMQTDPASDAKDAYIRIESSEKENVDSSWKEAEVYRLHGLGCNDTDSDDSTSI